VERIFSEDQLCLELSFFQNFANDGLSCQIAIRRPENASEEGGASWGEASSK